MPGPGELLVRVAATSVNPIDYKRRAGLTKDFYPMQFPDLMGVAIAGTVVKIGPGVEGFSVGDQVFAMADNTYAELCVVNAAILGKRLVNRSANVGRRVFGLLAKNVNQPA